MTPPKTPAELAASIEQLIATRHPRLLGLSGLPGSGKTTVAHMIDGAFTMSLDDFYLPKAERAAKGLRWRGGPGSHDLPLLYEVLDRLRAGEATVAVPRFEMARDDRGEPEVLDHVPDLVILEGWFLGYGGEGYGEVRDRLDLLVYIDVPMEVAKHRRFGREAGLRAAGGGFSEADMQRFWDESLAPNIERLMDEVRDAADVVLQA